MGRFQREKGKRGERDARDWLKSLGFHDARRTAQHKGICTGDVECPETLPNVHIEVKLWATYSMSKVREACFQSERDKAPGQWACVIWRCTGDRRVKSWRVSFIDRNVIYTIADDALVAANKLLQMNER